MTVIETISDLKRIDKGSVLSIGNFDGVHVGHQEILATAKKIAAKKNTQFAVMTFEPHPVALLYPEKALGVLTVLEFKKHLLADLGVDSLIVLKDGRELLNLSPLHFVEKFLVKNIQPAVVVEGPDFNFGRRRSGNIDTLKKLGAQKGFEVLVIEPRKVKLATGQLVKASSTIIRYMLESGHVADAATVLGRRYRLVEKIIPGHGRGKQLGFPTLNLQLPQQIIPAEGVYAGFVQIADSFQTACSSNQNIPAVFSVGQARTFGEDYPLLIEAHLLVENPTDLTGQYMAMDFIQHIRTQHKFKTEKDLIKQITKDCREAKKILTTRLAQE